MSFFDGEACPDDNLKGILSIHLKLGKYIHSIKIWKSLDFGIDWLRNGIFQIRKTQKCLYLENCAR